MVLDEVEFVDVPLVTPQAVVSLSCRNSGLS
jgi:hypothetical protein